MKPLHANVLHLPVQQTPGLRINLRNPACLAAVRKKVARAMDACNDANSRKYKKIIDKRTTARDWYEDGTRPAAPMARPFSPCYPESIGPDTASLHLPETGPINARVARLTAEGYQLYMREADRKMIDSGAVIDRVSVVRAMERARADVRPAPVRVKAKSRRKEHEHVQA